MRLFLPGLVVVFSGFVAANVSASSVDQKPDVVVASDGSGDVKTVREAINRVPENNTKRFVIFIKPGVYNEQVVIGPGKPFVSLLGENPETTRLTFKVRSSGPGSVWPWGSTYVGGNDFRAENITFENSFGHGAQAHALVTSADRLIFNNCRILGWQDTLYAKDGRQYFKNCRIEGATDFVCGGAAAVFESCVLHSKHDGYIAAPMRFAANDQTGFVFIACKLTAEHIKNGVFLGRPWGPHGRAVYLDTEMEAHIRAEGWGNWSKPANEKTAYFAEYNSKGPGAKPGERVKWSHQLSAEEVRPFELEKFLRGNDDWAPKKEE